MDQVNITLERRQVEVHAQAEEYHTLKRSFAQMEQQLARHTDEKRALEGRLHQFKAQLEVSRKDTAASQRTADDKARQVRTAVITIALYSLHLLACMVTVRSRIQVAAWTLPMTAEVQRLKGSNLLMHGDCQ